MADKKISTLVLIVDLNCGRCCKKIKKVLAKFCEIQNQSFDEKQNKVTISGPFDPETLKRKLWSTACKCIKDIQIPPPPKKEEPPKPLVSVPGIPVGPYGPMVRCKPCDECHVEPCSCKQRCKCLVEPCSCKPRCKCTVEPCSCKPRCKCTVEPYSCKKRCKCPVEPCSCSCSCSQLGPEECCTACYEGHGQHGIFKRAGCESSCKSGSNCWLM